MKQKPKLRGLGITGLKPSEDVKDAFCLSSVSLETVQLRSVSQLKNAANSKDFSESRTIVVVEVTKPARQVILQHVV